jgi:hypothetical protein
MLEHYLAKKKKGNELLIYAIIRMNLERKKPSPKSYILCGFITMEFCKI